MVKAMGIGFLGYVFFMLFSACWIAYTLNMQKTTLALGKQLVPDNPLLPRGFQDAITPPSQDRNNSVMFVLLPAVLVYGFILFKRYWAVIGFAMCFYVLTPLCSVLFMPRPCSPHYVNIIRRSLQRKLDDYLAAGDQVRLEAARFVLDRLDRVYGTQVGDPKNE